MRTGVESPPGKAPRLAELLAAVSLATDLADDAPPESALGDAVAAIELGRLAGLGGDDLRDVYYLALLYHLGCTATAEAHARAGGGDDISMRRSYGEVDFADRPRLLRVAATKVAVEWGPVARAQALVGMMRAGPGLMSEVVSGMCEVAARLAARLDAGDEVIDALGHAYARWDGKVFVTFPRGESISRIARIVHVVRVARVYARAGGPEAAAEVVRARRGSELDPRLCDLWLAHNEDLLGPNPGESVWDVALAAEPQPHRRVPSSHVDTVVAALADFIDLKVGHLAGHSPRVADLAVAAGEGVGLVEGDLRTLRRGALVHDLGCLSVPNRIWTKRASLNRAEWERVRLHPYHSQRVLTEAEPLRAAGELAGMHHERLDASGYHRGLPAAAIPLTARVLAAAEAYQSMVEERPWRPALSPSQAAAAVRREAAEGLLDRRGVDAVLDAAGHRPVGKREARTWPAGLTDREVDVLRMLARGRSNREIARELHVSEGTVHTHVINVYGKIEVNTRAGAVLFALEHDLIQI